MKVLLFLVACMVAGSACADCVFAGNSYPEGTIVNGYVCSADGKWVSTSY